MALRDLLVNLVVGVDGVKKLDDVDRKVKKTLGGFEQLGRSIQRLGYWMVAGYLMRGVKNLIVGQFEQAVALKASAAALGVTTDELQKYEYVADRMQIPVKNVAIAMRYFNRTVGEAALGTKAANKTFEQLGMSIKGADGKVRPTSDLLFEFADKLGKVESPALRTAYAMRTLGRGGAAMLPVLQNGSAELKKIFKDLDELGGGFNDRFIDEAAELNGRLKLLKMGWRGVYSALAHQVMPYLEKFAYWAIHGIKKLIWLAQHTYGFRTALMALASGTVIYALTRLLGVFNPFKTSIKQVMMTLAANLPLVAFVALLVAAYIAFDDLYTFMEGGDSLLGRFLDKVGGKGTSTRFLRDLKQAFKEIWAVLKPILPLIISIGKKILIAFFNSIPYVIKWGGVFASMVLDALDWGVTTMRQFGTLAAGIFEGLKKGGDFLSSWKAASDEAAGIKQGYTDRKKVYENLARTFDTIGSGLTGTGTPEPGDEDFMGPDQDDAGPVKRGGGRGAGAGASAAPIHVQVVNNIQGGANSNAVRRAVADGTRDGIKSGLSQKRDAYAAVTAGMPKSIGPFRPGASQ